MLEQVNNILKDARKNGYALGAFNTFNLETTQAILAAAEGEGKPVIVQTSEKALEYAGVEALVGMIKTLAQKISVPVILHLDHSQSLERVEECLKLGYTSVMLDGSKLSFEENVQKTKKAVELARQYGAWVEGELGEVGKEKLPTAEQLTEPAEAVEFIRATGIDALAVSVGNIHGRPQAGESLDFERLEEISKKVAIPLVFHGASGTPAEDIKKAISLGVAKINIDTDLRVVFSAAVREFLAQNPEAYDPREYLSVAKEAVQAKVKEKMRLFSGG